MFIRTLRRTSRDLSLLRRTAGIPATRQSTKRTESNDAPTLPGIVQTPFRAESIGKIPEFPHASPHYRKNLQKFIAKDYRISGTCDTYVHLYRVRQVDEFFYIIDLARIHPKSGAVSRRYRSRHYWAELPETLMDSLYPAILKAYREEEEVGATRKRWRIALVVIVLLVALLFFAPVDFHAFFT